MDSSIQDIQLGDLKNKVVDTVQRKLAGRSGNNPDGSVADGVADGGGGGNDPRQVHIGLADSAAQARGDMVTDVAGPAGAAAPANTEPSPYVPRGVPGQAGNNRRSCVVLFHNIDIVTCP